jgi:hypothetical protein
MECLFSPDVHFYHLVCAHNILIEARSIVFVWIISCEQKKIKFFNAKWRNYYYSVSQFVVGLAEKDSKTYLNEHSISCIRNEIHVESRSLNGMDTNNKWKKNVFFQEICSNDFIDHPHSSVSSLTCFFACFTLKIFFQKQKLAMGIFKIFFKQKIGNVFFVKCFWHSWETRPRKMDVSLTSFASIIVGVR